MDCHPSWINSWLVLDCQQLVLNAHSEWLEVLKFLQEQTTELEMPSWSSVLTALSKGSTSWNEVNSAWRLVTAEWGHKIRVFFNLDSVPQMVLHSLPFPWNATLPLQGATQSIFPSFLLDTNKLCFSYRLSLSWHIWVCFRPRTFALALYLQPLAQIAKVYCRHEIGLRTFWICYYLLLNESIAIRHFILTFPPYSVCYRSNYMAQGRRALS